MHKITIIPCFSRVCFVLLPLATLTFELLLSEPLQTPRLPSSPYTFPRLLLYYILGSPHHLVWMVLAALCLFCLYPSSPVWLVGWGRDKGGQGGSFLLSVGVLHVAAHVANFPCSLINSLVSKVIISTKIYVKQWTMSYAILSGHQYISWTNSIENDLIDIVRVTVNSAQQQRETKYRQRQTKSLQ